MPTDLKDLLSRYVAKLDLDGDGDLQPKQKYTSAGLGPVIDPSTFELRYSSPSQMERFDPACEGGCERKWWYRYRARVPDKATKAKDLGTQVHAQLEHYLKTSEEVLGELAMAGKRFIPEPGPDLLVESEYGRPEWPGPIPAPVRSVLVQCGVPLVLKIDLMHRRGTFLTDDGELVPEPGITAEVRDWKTSKQIDNEYDETTGILKSRGYAKQGVDLLSTWQMPSYGETARLVWPDIDHVRLSHGYFQSKKLRKASLRSALHPVEVIVERWRQSERVVERMKAVARIERVEDIPANPNACTAFGGCSYRDRCPRDPRQMLEQLVGGGVAARLLTSDKIVPKREVPMSLLAKFNNRQQAAATPPADPLAAEKAKLVAEEAAIKSGSILPPDVPAAQKPAETSGQTITASCGHTVPAEVTSKLPDGTIKHIGCAGAGATVPATQTEAAKAPEYTPGSSCPAAGQQIDCTVKQVATKKYDCACGEKSLKIKPEEMGEGYAAIVPKHKVPGEPPKAAEPVKQPEPTKQPEVKIEVKSEVIVDRAELPGTRVGIAPTTVDLYCGAIEDGVPYQRLEDYAQALADRLAQKFETPDLRASIGDTPIAFGKWVGVLSALVKTEPPAPGAYLVDPASDFGMIAFKALAPMKLGRVVRGIK